MLRAIDPTGDCGLRIADYGLERAGRTSAPVEIGIGVEDDPARKSEFDVPTHSPLRASRSSAFTLVEMLVAMAITLVMMGAVVTLFANVSNSVRDRRATIEMSGQLRHARNMLQQDLQGATCPGLTWRRPEANQGYIEIIEGPYREGNASALIDRDIPVANGEIDHTTSIIPTSNLPLADPTWVTDGAALGDYDDVLMLTVRNEHEPFVGNMPAQVRTNSTNNAHSFADWTTQTIESPLTEIVWYAVENPAQDENANGFFGEPGLRTIYRRTLLIAPWVNPYRYVDNNGAVFETFKEPNSNGGQTFNAKPGLVRILPDFVHEKDADQALAALIAVQDRFDLSVRLEFDPLLDAPNGRWKIVANTLGDLTKRENRYEHNQIRRSSLQRVYPFAAAAIGSNYTSGSSLKVQFVYDRESPTTVPTTLPAASATSGPLFGVPNAIVNYSTNAAVNLTDKNRRSLSRPYVYVDETCSTDATPRAMLDENGAVVRVTHSLVPLWGTRRGEDVMLSDALAFDLRVYDPNAPLFGVRDLPVTPTSDTRVVLEPTDPAWATAYASADNMNGSFSSIGKNNNNNAVYPFVGTGAYVDLGYGFNTGKIGVSLYAPGYAAAYSSGGLPWFFAPAFATQYALANMLPVANPGALTDVYGNQLAPGYAVYDTWSFHYENDGVDEDNDSIIDQGTNGLDDPGHYYDPSIDKSQVISRIRNGPDDVGERETAPPYDKPLRGVQVILRVYERDSRQIRQVSVDQHFVPE